MLAEARVSKRKILGGQWPREKAARYYVPGVVKAFAVVGALSIPAWASLIAWAALKVVRRIGGN